MTVYFTVKHPSDAATLFSARADTARAMANSITAARPKAEWEARAEIWAEAASIISRTLLVGETPPAPTPAPTAAPPPARDPWLERREPEDGAP